MLTAWFDFNRCDEHANQFLYTEIPHRYLFKPKEWFARQKDAGKTITRLYTANIRAGERYFLRVLLLHVPGATSFEYLKTFRGLVQQYFRDACLGLLANDNLWSDTMQELVLTATPSKIRKTFSFILIPGDPNNPAGLWKTFSESMIEDYGRNQPEAEALQRALTVIQRILQQFGKCLNNFGLPALEQAPVVDLPKCYRNEKCSSRTSSNIKSRTTCCC